MLFVQLKQKIVLKKCSISVNIATASDVIIDKKNMFKRLCKNILKFCSWCFEKIMFKKMLYK